MHIYDEEMPDMLFDDIYIGVGIVYPLQLLHSRRNSYVIRYYDGHGAYQQEVGHILDVRYHRRNACDSYVEYLRFGYRELQPRYDRRFAHIVDNVFVYDLLGR